MNNLLTSSIIAMLCLPAASHAQQINDSEKTAVEQVLNKCAVGVQTGRITVDSTAVAGDSPAAT